MSSRRSPALASRTALIVALKNLAVRKMSARAVSVRALDASAASTRAARVAREGRTPEGGISLGLVASLTGRLSLAFSTLPIESHLLHAVRLAVEFCRAWSWDLPCDV